MKNNYFNKKSIFLTGGTGSFGRAFIEEIIKKKFKLKKLIIFSRDELKQSQLSKQYPESKFPFIRFFLGDIRDYDRLKFAMPEVDIVVHAAALKQVQAAEYNPFEFIQTNIIGSQNIIKSSIYHKVKNVIALSTDKAASAINLYGATKLCSDKLFISANNISGKNNIKFSVVRYGNVFGSRGSVIPHFLDILKKKNVFPVTDKRMTRFNITLQQGVKVVMDALLINKGGEIFVPKCQSYNILDLVKAINLKAKIKVIGIRAGEKIHEELITTSDSLKTIESVDGFIILNDINKIIFNYYKKKGYKKVKDGFSYNSLENKDHLTVNQIAQLINKNKDKLDC